MIVVCVFVLFNSETICSTVIGTLLEPSRRTNLTCARFEVLTAVLLKTQVFRDVTLSWIA
jgi:hypothetical protein